MLYVINNMGCSSTNKGGSVMERNLKGMLVAIVLLAVCITGVTEKMVFGQPVVMPTVRLKGTVFASDTKGPEGGLATMKVFMGKMEWMFNISKAEDIYDQDITGMDLLDDMDDSLELKEAKKGVLAPLQKLDVAGKTVTLEGLLDESNGFMAVTKLTIGN